MYRERTVVAENAGLSRSTIGGQADERVDMIECAQDVGNGARPGVVDHRCAAGCSVHVHGVHAVTGAPCRAAADESVDATGNDDVHRPSNCSSVSGDLPRPSPETAFCSSR